MGIGKTGASKSRGKAKMRRKRAQLGRTTPEVEPVKVKRVDPAQLADGWMKPGA